MNQKDKDAEKASYTVGTPKVEHETVARGKDESGSTYQVRSGSDGSTRYDKYSESDTEGTHDHRWAKTDATGTQHMEGSAIRQDNH